MGLVDKIKDLTGFGEIDYEEDFEEEVEEIEESSRMRKPSLVKKNKVVPMPSADAQNRIVVLKPKCFNSSIIPKQN